MKMIYHVIVLSVSIVSLSLQGAGVSVPQEQLYGLFVELTPSDKLKITRYKIKGPSTSEYEEVSFDTLPVEKQLELLKINRPNYDVSVKKSKGTSREASTRLLLKLVDEKIKTLQKAIAGELKRRAASRSVSVSSAPTPVDEREETSLSSRASSSSATPRT